MVLGSHERVARLTVLQTLQRVEDTPTSVVQQKDTQVPAQVLVPQRILVVEEAQVADDTEHLLVRHAREARRRRQRPVDAVHAPITEHLMLGIGVRQTDGRRVRVMHVHILSLADLLLKQFHGRHLRIVRLVGIHVIPDPVQQIFPLLHEVNLPHFQHRSQIVLHITAATLDDICQVHEGVGHRSRLVHQPALLGPSQVLLQALAHDRATHVQHEVGCVALIIGHEIHGLVHQRVQRLPTKQQRSFGLQEVQGDSGSLVFREFVGCAVNLPFLRQLLDGELEQRLRDGHVDMYGATAVMQCLQQRLVHQTVTIPVFFLIVRLRQRHRLAHEPSESIRLWQRLSVQLVYPLRRTVGRHHDQRRALVIRLRNGRHQV